MKLSEFVKEKRNAARLTQPELAQKAGVGLRFVRELEQDKETLRIDKINQVLKLFGYEMGPIEVNRAYLLTADTGTFQPKSNEVNLIQKKNES